MIKGQIQNAGEADESQIQAQTPVQGVASFKIEIAVEAEAVVGADHPVILSQTPNLVSKKCERCDSSHPCSEASTRRENL